MAVEPSRSPFCEYRPCRIRLQDGEVRDFVYAVEASSYIVEWGIWPDEDPGKRSTPITEVAEIQESPFRLPPGLANKLYAAGESGMGYCIFTVVLRDGRRLPFLMGNAVDFPALPIGTTTHDIVDVLPHVGLDQLSGPEVPSESSADYSWCLYGG